MHSLGRGRIEMKKSKHSDFIRINGINHTMCIYEQLIMDIHSEDVSIVHQHTGKNGAIVFIYDDKRIIT